MHPNQNDTSRRTLASRMQDAIKSLLGSGARQLFSARRRRTNEDDDDVDDPGVGIHDEDEENDFYNHGRTPSVTTTTTVSARDIATTVSRGTFGSMFTSGRGSVTPVKGTMTEPRRQRRDDVDEALRERASNANEGILATTTGPTTTGTERVKSTVVVKPSSPGSMKRKKGASGGLPVKNINFDAEDADADDARTTPKSAKGTPGEGRAYVTPGRGNKTTTNDANAAFSPDVGGGLMASPNITMGRRVGDVLAGLEVESESDAETEALDNLDDDDLDDDDLDAGGTQGYEDDYAGGTQVVMDSAELCEAPSRVALALALKEEEEAEPPCTRPGDAAIRLLRRRLFGLNRERPIDADGLDFAPNLKAHRDHLLNILEDTVSGGQNNSVLIVGNRGSGKTLILDSALKILEDRHSGKVVTVHLSGLLHADERIAMQKIAAQLCPNMNENEAGRSSGGFAENVAFMTEMLKLLQGGQRGVVFILDDFELFAMRSKQTLLYAITDLLQQSTVQAAVVGVTCRHSVDRMLEKRVASRFSNRRIVIAPPGNTVSMVDGVAKALKLTEKDKYLCPSEPDFVQQWNFHVHAAMMSPAVKRELEHYGRLENTPASVSKMACAILSRVNRRLGKVTGQDIVDAANSFKRNSFIDSLIGATPLELLLCVAMYRMHTARKRPSFTFDALAQELNDMGTREQLTHAKDCSRSVLVRAFENLVTLGVATAHKSGSGVRGAALKEYKNIVLVIADDELRDAIRRHPNTIPGLVDFMDHESLRMAHVV
jgi:origin recognition complex subunit 4